MEVNKLRVIQDYDKLSEELKEQIKLVYPEGYSQHLIEFRNSKGELVSALPFETFEKIYMVRMSIRRAEQIVDNDDDFDDDGILREDVKEKYEDEYSDIEYLSENENYDAD
ncbi:MAG: hypothetical protein HQ521_19620 [Bacteroidetes bacterium]|nr:hypothetical protein [Bacteroidota bacterium]